MRWVLGSCPGLPLTLAWVFCLSQLPVSLHGAAWEGEVWAVRTNFP